MTVDDVAAAARGTAYRAFCALAGASERIDLLVRKDVPKGVREDAAAGYRRLVVIGTRQAAEALRLASTLCTMLRLDINLEDCSRCRGRGYVRSPRFERGRQLDCCASCGGSGLQERSGSGPDQVADRRLDEPHHRT